MLILLNNQIALLFYRAIFYLIFQGDTMNAAIISLLFLAFAIIMFVWKKSY